MTKAICDRCREFKEMTHEKAVEWSNGGIFYCDECQKELKSIRNKIKLDRIK